MIKHIVLFRLKDELSKEEKEKIGRNFKLAIESLPMKIKQIRKIEVGINLNPEEKWDICLDGEFDNMDDLGTYIVHPRHKRAAAILKDAKQDRACVDYEFFRLFEAKKQGSFKEVEE